MDTVLTLCNEKSKQPTETDAAFAQRLMMALDRLSEDNWPKLPKEWQLWSNNAAEQYEMNHPLPPIPGAAEVLPPEGKKGTAAVGAVRILMGLLIDRPALTLAKVLEEMAQQGVTMSKTSARDLDYKLRRFVQALSTRGMLTEKLLSHRWLKTTPAQAAPAEEELAEEVEQPEVAIS